MLILWRISKMFKSYYSNVFKLMHNVEEVPSQIKL